jgi:hypothetical protein
MGTAHSRCCAPKRPIFGRLNRDHVGDLTKTISAVVMRSDFAQSFHVLKQLRDQFLFPFFALRHTVKKLFSAVFFSDRFYVETHRNRRLLLKNTINI